MHPDLSDAAWHKSSLSGDGPSCVEVAIGKSVIAVRDTKDREAGMLMFTPDEWQAFIGGVRLGEFDL
ncbi:DUF397 domain-containing protein [Nonomuraea longicatena]|uniref:DUF397 domain-containing protein n=1 Tax=Nonomuraea longicatena TaxID=83682 RepID=A0ABP4AYG7_9ACTN